jgi:threonylcarbamoyladenosine tRNA methylthiotransferase MtaB
MEAGFREIVLTGIHIGLYGKDLSPCITLERLLEYLLEKTSGVRFRLSSIDAHEIRDELIELIAVSDRLCDHLHIPLQSGSPGILKAMRRRSSIEEFREVCDKAISAVPYLGLGTDVIAGFPGESESDFELTCGMIEEIPFSYVHVFPFSPRPGTPASELGNEMVREGVVARRAMDLRQIALEGGRLFRKRQVGHNEEILVEREMGTWYMGRCSNYVKAFIDSDHISVGDLKKVVVEDVWRDGIWVDVR